MITLAASLPSNRRAAGCQSEQLTQGLPSMTELLFTLLVYIPSPEIDFETEINQGSSINRCPASALTAKHHITLFPQTFQVSSKRLWSFNVVHFKKTVSSLNDLNYMIHSKALYLQNIFLHSERSATVNNFYTVHLNELFIKILHQST